MSYTIAKALKQRFDVVVCPSCGDWNLKPNGYERDLGAHHCEKCWKRTGDFVVLVVRRPPKNLR